MKKVIFRLCRILFTVLFVLTAAVPAAADDTVSDWDLIMKAANEENISKEAEMYSASLLYRLKENDGVLSDRKYTEYSRAVLTLSVLDMDPSNIGGYDLLSRLEERENVKKQGINGPVWALIALDSGNFRSYSRTAYVKEILDKELPDGGWNMEGTGAADPDVTAMALQALGAYLRYGQVKQAVERGIEILSQMQNSSGGYSSCGTENAESVSQVIIALCELGVSVKDRRFVKNGHTMEENLKGFRLSDGTFMHTKQAGEADALATEQGMLALTEIRRQEAGKPPVYRMKQGNE